MAVCKKSRCEALGLSYLYLGDVVMMVLVVVVVGRPARSPARRARGRGGAPQRAPRTPRPAARRRPRTAPGTARPRRRRLSPRLRGL